MATPEEKAALYQLALQQEAEKANIAVNKAQQLADIQQQSAAQKAFGGAEANFDFYPESKGNDLISAFDRYVNQETLQNPFSVAGRSVLKTPLPKSDNFWELLAGNAAQGLVGSGLQSYGESDILGQFQEEVGPTLGGLYPEIELDGVKDLDATRLALIQALGDRQQQDKLEQLGIRAAGSRRGLPMGRVLGNSQPQSLDEYYDYYKNELGLGETTTKARMTGLQRSADETLNKNIPGAFEAAADAKGQARLIRQGMEDFGDTGPIYGPAKKTLFSALDATGLDDFFGVDTDKALRGARAFDISAWKTAFLNKMPGAITEKELDKMLNLGAGITASNMTNEKFAKAAEKAATIAELYGQAQEEYYAANGGNMTGFAGQWGKIKSKLIDDISEVEPSSLTPTQTDQDLSKYTPQQIAYMRSKGMIK